jgi:MFS family permease
MKRILQSVQHDYPPQFWLLFWGMLLATAGASMIWPFLMIYVSEKLALPMTSVASLMTLNAATRLTASLIAGPVTDRVGRKITMIVGLAGMGVLYLAMIPAETIAAFAVLMALRGICNPLYRVGADAMVADLIPTRQRADAYALTRLSKNVGVALGPAVGGFVATQSYTITFFVAAGGLIAFSVLMAFFARETLPTVNREEQKQTSTIESYLQIFSDRPFMVFVGAFTLVQIASVMVWILLSVYTKENYQILENQYGFIPMTNALMVVILQVFVTRRTKRHRPLPIMAAGGLFYALGVSSIALGTNFWHFWASMIVVTIGELMIVPTATTYTANLAPPDMRGRYMSIFSLTWGIGTGIGPVVGGYLNDTIGPQAIWYGGGLIALAGTAWFIIQALTKEQAPDVVKPSGA